MAQVSSNGKEPKVKWQIPDEKSDQPFYCAGSLVELKRAIKTAGGAPLFYDEPPDSLLRLSNRYYSTMHSSLYYLAARTLGCELKERAIYDNFEEARHGDDHPFIAKIDPSGGAQSWNRKFRLRPADTITRTGCCAASASRVCEEEFQRDPDTFVGFEVFLVSLISGIASGAGDDCA